MKDRRKPYGVDVRGKKGRGHVRAKGGLLVKKVGNSRFMRASKKSKWGQVLHCSILSS